MMYVIVQELIAEANSRQTRHGYTAQYSEQKDLNCIVLLAEVASQHYCNHCCSSGNSNEGGADTDSSTVGIVAHTCVLSTSPNRAKR